MFGRLERWLVPLQFENGHAPKDLERSYLRSPHDVLTRAQAERTRLRVCHACGRKAGKDDPIVVLLNGGFYGRLVWRQHENARCMRVSFSKYG